MSIFLHPPTTSLFSTTSYGSGVASTQTYDAQRGLSCVRTDSGGTGEKVGFIGKAVPASTPWTATCRIIIGPTVTPEYHRMGMALYSSVSTKYLLFGQNTQNTASGVRLTWYYFSNQTTISGGAENTYTIQNLPQWYRISFDGTTYTLSISFDGAITFFTYATATAAANLTATHIGVMFNSNNAFSASSRPTITVMYWDDPDFPA